MMIKMNLNLSTIIFPHTNKNPYEKQALDQKASNSKEKEAIEMLIVKINVLFFEKLKLKLKL